MATSTFFTPNTTTDKFYTDTTRFADQDRATRLANIYTQQRGQFLADPDSFTQMYNDTSDPDFVKAQARIADTQQSRVWQNPSIGQLSGIMAKTPMENPLDIYNKALESLGIADARTRVQSTKEQLMNTENLLRNVEGNVSGRTQDSVVTEAQRQRLVAQEQEPLNEAMRVQGQNFDLAAGDYDRKIAEGTAQTEYGIQGQIQKRQALVDRMELMMDRAKTAEDKRRWAAELKLQKQKLSEDTRRWNAEFALEKENFALKKASASRVASSGGGSGGSRGGSSGGGSSGGSSSSGANMSGLDSWFDTQWQKKPYASRQEQDAWINSWFSASGITDPEDRQQYWDYINSTRKRPTDPTTDWLYKK
jgi:hypothetical protein